MLRFSLHILLHCKDLGSVCIIHIFVYLGVNFHQFSLSFRSLPLQVYFENCTWILYSRPEPLAVLGTQAGSPDLELHR